MKKKGRRVPPRPEIAAIVNKAGPLTREDIDQALVAHVNYFYPVQSFSITAESMPEPTPYERGVLDRYQDKGRKK